MPQQRDKSTTEFIATALTVVGLWIGAAATNLDPRWTLLATTVSAVLYAVAKGINRYNSDLQRGWSRTEFWVAVIQIIAMAAAVLINSNALPPRDAALAAALVSGAYALSRSLAKPTPVTQLSAGSSGGIAAAPALRRAERVPLV